MAGFDVAAATVALRVAGCEDASALPAMLAIAMATNASAAIAVSLRRGPFPLVLVFMRGPRWFRGGTVRPG